MRADADFFCLPAERVVFDKSNVSIDHWSPIFSPYIEYNFLFLPQVEYNFYFFLKY